MSQVMIQKVSRTTDTNKEVDSQQKNRPATKRWDQKRLNVLLGDLELPKDAGELIASNLKRDGHLATNTSVTF